MLIKVCICEDEERDQQEAGMFLQRWQERSGHEIMLRSYADSDRLFGAIDDNFETFDLFILDIEMNTPLEGLQLAHKIRADNEHIPIIFITRHDELALDSYGVHALNFIVKPIDEARMFTTLDRLASILERRVKGFFSCNIEGTLRRFPYYEILYFVTDAADGHYILINGDASLRFRNKISDLVNSNPEIFILCHQSYIVNLDHLRTIQGNTATLSDGSVVAISKGNLSRVRQRFLNQYRVFA